MSNYQIQSLNFLPENLRGYELYTKFSEVLDYVLDTYHTKNIDILKALYDIKNSNFSYEEILKLLGSENFLEFDVGSEQFKVLCVLLSNLYEIKGTQRGLRYLLRLLNLDATVYEWYDINRWYHEGDPSWTHEVPKCSIVIDLGFSDLPLGVCDIRSKWAIPRTGDPAESVLGPTQAFEDVEGKFRAFADQLLWVCVTLDEIRWIKKLTDYVDVRDEFAWFATEIFYEKYSPYVTNCPGTIQVGFPVFQTFAYVGDDVVVGQVQYLFFPFIVRSLQQYNSPINYDGWENTGIVGYSHQIVSPTPPIVGTSGLIVRPTEYYWEWNWDEWLPDSYLILKHVVVGEMWVEGDISAGTPRVSGCNPSRIGVHKEVGIIQDLPIHRGVYVGDDRFVQEPTNPGDSYLVDTQPGDVLDVGPEESLEDQVSEDSDLSLHKESALSSNISDLYEPLVVGDPTKFVGDADLRVGVDYFFTWFEVSKDIELVEQFYTSCLQVGSWGHSYYPDTPYIFVVGDPVTVGSSYCVGFRTYPEHYVDRDPLLCIGTSLVVGGGELVNPSLYIGQGFNYVGELSPWNASACVGDSKNIIYEWLEYSETQFLESEVDVLDQVDAPETETTLSSDIRESLWAKVVGGTSTVDRVEVFVVGTGETIGSSPEVGHEDVFGDTYVTEDPFCHVEADTEVSDISEQVLIEVPVVGSSAFPIGYSYEHPLLAGTFNVGSHTVGEVEVFVDAKIFVARDSWGRSYTGAEAIVSAVFDASTSETSIEEEIDVWDELDVVEETTDTNFEEVVFAGRGLVGEGTIEYRYRVGDIVVGPSIIGDAETYVARDQISVLTYTVEEEGIDLFSPEEQFNPNAITMPVLFGHDPNNLFIVEGVSFDYLAGEGEVPYVYDPDFNVTNVITDLLQYTIDED